MSELSMLSQSCSTNGIPPAFMRYPLFI